MNCTHNIVSLRFGNKGGKGWLRVMTATWVALCMQMGVAGCEEDAVGIDLNSTSRAVVLSSVVQANHPIDVYVASSVSYNDTASAAPINGTVITLHISGHQPLSQTLDNDQTTATFASCNAQSGDTIWLTVATPSNTLQTTQSSILAAETVVPSITEILAVDTTTISSQNRLDMSLSLSDNPQTTDFYQIEVRRRIFANGVATDSLVKCEYTSIYFNPTSLNLSSDDNYIGLFDDELISGKATLRFRAPWSSLRVGTDTLTADSTAVVVRLLHHSEDYFTFLQSLIEAREFMQVPILGSTPLHSNVIGGYGILGSSAFDEQEFMVWRREETEGN